MNDLRYYLLSDNSVQWFSKIAAVSGTPGKGEHYEYYYPKQIVELLDLELGIKGEFIKNIVDREPNFYNRMFSDMTYVGWAISEQEYKRLKRIVELLPAHREYLKLTESK